MPSSECQNPENQKKKGRVSFLLLLDYGKFPTQKQMAGYGGARLCAIIKWSSCAVVVCACLALCTKFFASSAPSLWEKITIYAQYDPVKAIGGAYHECCFKRSMSALLKCAWGRNDVSCTDYMTGTMNGCEDAICSMIIDNHGNTPLHVLSSIGLCKAADWLMTACPRYLFEKNAHGSLPRDVFGSACIKYEMNLRMNQLQAEKNDT